jgi:hypothetical protein
VPIEPREKSTRIRKPTVRFNLGATTEPRATLTANIASIFTIAQIAEAEGRFVMVGDVGSAYLNAVMPRGSLEPEVTKKLIRQDASFLPFHRRNKALYGCIESAKLWYYELAGTLKINGFKPNPVAVSGTFPFPACLVRHSQGRHIHHD